MSKMSGRNLGTAAVVGRATAEKFSAVEGIRRSERTGRILAASDALRETPEQLRQRVRLEFQAKK